MSRELITLGSQIKALGDNRFGGYLVRWNQPGETDLHGEMFTPDCDFMLDDYPLKGLRVLFHHGLDDKIGVEPIGEIATHKMDEWGLWVEGVYAEHRRYIEYVKRMVRDGVLSFSSGALPQGVKTAKSGHIQRWPIIEGSLTFCPADWRSVIDERSGTQVTPLKALREVLKEVDSPLIEAQDDTPSGVNNTAKADDLTSTEETPSLIGETDMLDETLTQAIRDEIEALLIARGVLTEAEAEEPAVEDIIETAVEEAAEEVMEEVIEDTADEVAEEVAEELDDEQIAVIASRAAEKAISRLSKKKAGRRQAIRNAVRGSAKSALSAVFEDDPRPVSKLGNRRHDGTTAKSAGGSRIQVSTKYDRMSVTDLAFMTLLLGGNTRKRYTPSRELMKTIADKTVKAAHSGHHVTGSVLKTAYAIKADELDHTTNDGYGEEWVGEIWASELWDRVYDEDPIAGLFESIDMPSENYRLPLVTSAPVVYAVPETTDAEQLQLHDETKTAIPSSKIGTGDLEMHAVKLAARVGWSNELNEDSVVPIIPTFRREMERALMEAIAGVFLFADYEASGNINYAGGTASSAIGNWFVDNAGILKYALNNTSTHGVDFGGAAPSVEKIRQMRARMPARYGKRTDNLAWITDYQTYMKLLNIPELLTEDKYGVDATIKTGGLQYMDGIPVYVTDVMGLASATGKISSTANQNTLGRLALVYRPGIITGYRRTSNITVEFLSYYDAYMMTGTVRPAVLSYDNDVAVVGFNIGV